MKLHRTDVEHLRSVFMAVENGDIGMLKSLGIRVSSLVSILITWSHGLTLHSRTPSWEMSSFSWRSWLILAFWTDIKLSNINYVR